MPNHCRDLLDQVEPKDLTQIALQMLFTIERMELIIPEITDTIRKALEQGRLTPQPPAAGEVAELVEWLREQEAMAYAIMDIAESRRYARAADLLQRQHPQPVAEGPTLKEISDWIILEKKNGARWAAKTDHHDALPVACAAIHAFAGSRFAPPAGGGE